MKKTGVVFFNVNDDTEVNLENITTLSLHNSGESFVTVNGSTVVYPQEQKQIVVPDGTVSDLSLKVAFNKTKLSENPTQSTVGYTDFFNEHPTDNSIEYTNEVTMPEAFDMTKTGLFNFQMQLNTNSYSYGKNFSISVRLNGVEKATVPIYDSERNTAEEGFTPIKKDVNLDVLVGDVLTVHVKSFPEATTNALNEPVFASSLDSNWTFNLFQLVSVNNKNLEFIYKKLQSCSPYTT